MSEIDDNSVATDDYNHGETTSTKSVNYHHGQRYTLKLSEKQTKVLKAICGTLIGCLDDSEIDSLCFNTENSTPPSTSATTKRYSINTSAMMMLKNSEKIREFAKFDLSNSDEFIERVLDRLSKCLTVEKLAHISGVLKKLGSKGFINAQIANYNKPFYGLTKKQQEQVILKWSTHSTASTRELFRTFTFFICSTFWLDPYGFNSLIGYPGPDPEANSSRFTSRQFSTFEFLKINNNDGIVINTCGESSTNTQNKPKKDQIDQGIEADGTNGKKLEEEDLNYDVVVVSNFTENVDGNHYGSKIVVGSHHPASMAANFPWNSTFKHKQFMLEYTHISPLLVITRDRDAGRIVIDSRGQPKLYYKVSQHDSKSAVAGIIASLKILVAAGAKRVGTCQAGLEEFEVSDDVNPLNDVKFQCYLDKVKKIGAPSNQILLGSMHQMGTCCMGDDPIKSVVNPTGETWEVENLFVADSSIFPTAIGRRSSIRWSMNDVPKRKLNRLSLGNPLSNSFNGSFNLLNRRKGAE
ncbi:1862_t:CDS:2 [Entrophospora sp. SA101]|nr:1862_t:CDS:2 [Entrophospora sp. SA101]